MADELPPPPPRRAGRECGYEHRAELLAANRALGAALTKLARDADPDARAAGAVIAATMADLVDQAARLAVESSGKARRHAADVARMMPKLERQLAAARERVAIRNQPVRPVRNP